ncbi:hypothetical protein [Streptomyces sp. TRM68367]|uniref:hypothetical protein n=1 Tax=Streptomyces sp. TRM68367 TaxID=2758415 RepID=UPI00165AC9A8|nr:hypothetical protein [Streptomyces sp. TRM68367]MBC9725546.1 hypothetical protein [Streptomyces sp. TRM68367]
MPRPTVAQIAYGSCTVIFSTLAMLLLSQTTSGPGIALITASALLLGLLVAMTLPLPKPAKAVEQPPVKEPVVASVAPATAPATVEPVGERAAS